MKEIVINTKSSHYSIFIQNGLSNSIHSFLTSTRHIIITDENVYALYEQSMRNISQYIIVIKAGETNKTYETVQYIYQQLINLQATRNDILIAFGGGVVGDLCGFVAATYMRGLDYIQIPTTLLAQVDSSVGGKTGYNIGKLKNIVGAFKHPNMVLIDTEYLNTLPEREFNNGVAEIIKAGMIKDSDLLLLLKEDLCNQLENVIAKAIEVKKYFVESDEYDKGIRNILNFGHTIGHALETITSHELLHGEAIAIGMYSVSKHPLIKQLCIQFKLPYELPVSLIKIRDKIIHDKKRSDDYINAIWCDEIEKPIIIKMTIDEFIEKVGVKNEIVND